MLDNNFTLDFIDLYLLAMLTYPHCDYTRYPDTKIKPKNYTERFGIVKTSPEIWEVMDKRVERIRTWIEQKKNIYEGYE